MIEPGRSWAYLALFSEIGFSLLLTTLIGVLAGYWIDKQFGTLPVFVLVGFLIGAGSGTVVIAKVVSRFLEDTDPPAT
jgi:ATP synthase protein I